MYLLKYYIARALKYNHCTFLMNGTGKLKTFSFKNKMVYFCANLQATAATIAAPRPLPSLDSLIMIPLQGANSLMAALIL